MTQARDQIGLFEDAHARRTDPETSHAAAASVRNIRKSQSNILQVLKKNGPLSDEELIRHYRAAGLPPQSESGIRTRRAELVRLSLVVDSGDKAVTASGRNTILWEAV